MEPGKFYHVYNRGNNKENIFFEERNYHHFLKLFDKYLLSFVEVYAYCLMPNHFHFLIRVKENTIDQGGFKNHPGLNEAFKYFFMSYAKAINKSYNRTGSLFQQKFKRKEITDDAYFTEIILYIHSNPLKAGLCKNYEEWQYSSYQAIVNNNTTKINRDDTLKWFGNKDLFIKVHLDKLQ